MAKLCLVGEPRIAANGVTYEISPRASMELLALIVLRQPAPLTRSEGTELLYHHIEELSGPVAARQQFRIALSKLRRALVSANLDDQLQLNGEDLRLTVPWEVDALQPIQAQSLKELRECFQPVIPHWDHERWLWLRNEYADRLSRRFLELFEDQRKLFRAQPELAREFQQLALLGSDLYPLEPGFARVSTSLAELEGNPDRAATLRAEFASRWSAKFPSEPVPASLDWPLTAHQPVTHLRSRRTVLTGVTVVATILLLAVLNARGRVSTKTVPITLEQLPTERIELGTFRLTIRKYQLPRTEPPILVGVGPRTDGTPLLMLAIREQEWVTDVDGPPSRVPKPWDFDFGDVRFHVIGRWAEGWRQIGKPGVESLATPEYTRVVPPTHIGQGLFFTQRICPHPFGCHYDCAYLRDGKIVPLVVDGVKPQTVMMFFADATSIYGMYSLGKSDGWAYHPFITDRSTLKTRNGGEPFAIGRLSDGTWVCSPKVTRLVRRDYVLRDTKEVVLVRPDGARQVLHRNAKWTHVVGDIIAVGVDEPSSNDSYSHTEFYDGRGDPIPQLNAIGPRVANISTDVEKRHMAFIPFDNNPNVRTAYLLSPESLPSAR